MRGSSPPLEQQQQKPPFDAKFGLLSCTPSPSLHLFPFLLWPRRPRRCLSAVKQLRVAVKEPQLKPKLLNLTIKQLQLRVRHQSVPVRYLHRNSTLSRLNSCCSTQNHIPFRKYWKISLWRLPNVCLLTVLLATRQSESCADFASEHGLNQPDFVALNPTIHCQRP